MGTDPQSSSPELECPKRPEDDNRTPGWVGTVPASNGLLQAMSTSITPSALAVDDDPLILFDIQNILEDAGFRCHDADDGDAAIVLLGKHADSVTLLFSDVEMPGSIDGFALARHVAEHWPWIEIVITSGNIRPNSGDMPEKATFIAKPFSAQMVRDHLRRTLPDDKKPEPLRQPA